MPAAAAGGNHARRQLRAPVMRPGPRSDWEDDLTKLCQAMPFMVGCSMWAQCKARAASTPPPLPPALLAYRRCSLCLCAAASTAAAAACV